MILELRDPEAAYQVALPSSRAHSALQQLMARNLDFKGPASNPNSHNTHAFAAKFPPSLPRLFIDELTKEGQLVLDPIAGSGTALVEGMFASRHCIGVDLDPLAAKIIKAKTTRYDVTHLELLAEAIGDHARLLAASLG